MSESKPTRLSEVDLLRLRLLHERQAHFEAQKRAVAAELKLEEAALVQRFHDSYAMGADDRVDPLTGEIGRSGQERADR